MPCAKFISVHEQLSLFKFQEGFLSPVLPPLYFIDRHRQKEGLGTMEAHLSKKRRATMMFLCKPHWFPGDYDSH